MKISKHLYALAIAGACSASVYAQNTLTFDFLEISGNVQVTVTGGVTGSLWVFGSTESVGPAVEVNPRLSANSSFFVYTHTSFPGRTLWNTASGVTVNGPSSIFGTSGYANLAASASNPTSVGFFRNSVGNNYLYTPVGWSSADQSSLANVITIPSATFSSLKMTAGTYNWYVSNSGATITDTITFNIGSVTPVPEASGSVAGLGLAMAGLYQLRRRKAAGKVVEG